MGAFEWKRPSPRSPVAAPAGHWAPDICCSGTQQLSNAATHFLSSRLLIVSIPAPSVYCITECWANPRCRQLQLCPPANRMPPPTPQAPCSAPPIPLYTGLCETAAMQKPDATMPHGLTGGTLQEM
uniref:Uncharacterized protein n=1 Tax=Eutreptiella gymnastica TaxID=73025 RepID=A0A7S4FR16_9EUGL